MSQKKVFMLRLDPAVYEALERWAADEFRSVNGQLEWIIDAKLKEHRQGPGKSPCAETKSTKTGKSYGPE